MKFTKKQSQILGLSYEQTQILAVLNPDEPLSVSSVAQLSCIARTTTSYHLHKLYTRGFVERVKIGSLFRWRLRSRRSLKYDLESAISILTFSNGADATKDNVLVEHGLQNVYAALERILELNRTERVYVIQGNIAAEESVRKINERFMFRLHERIKEKEIIMEGVIGERVLALFQKLSKEQLQSHAGRLMITHVVPDEYMEFNTEMFLFRKTVMFVNAQEGTAVIINNSAAVDALRSMLRLMQGVGRKIDLNAYIYSLLKQ